MPPDARDLCLKAGEANTEMLRYFNIALKHYEASVAENKAEPTIYPDLHVAQQIRESQKAWSNYLTAECNAVSDAWYPATYRFEALFQCTIHLTDQRTHDIWSNWLQGPGQNPLLPEPHPQRD